MSAVLPVTGSTTTLHRPDGLADACTLLDRLDEPMVYAGGTAVQILAKQGVLFASDLVDLSRVPGLNRIEQTPAGLRVGPMVSLRRMETDLTVRRVVPLAARVYGKVANPRVRNTATVGGNLAHGDYRLDPPGALLVLDAHLELTSTAGTRTVAARDFFTGFQTTALQRGELVTGVHLPTQPAGGFAYAKLSSLSANDWPCASAAALLIRGRSEQTLRLALGAVSDRPVHRELVLPAAATEADVLAAAHDTADQLIDPIPDVRGGVAFKRRLGLVAVRDAVTEALHATPPSPEDHTTREEDGDAPRTPRRRWWRGR